MQRTIVLAHEDGELKAGIWLALGAAGHYVTLAATGKDALHVCQTALPDMLIIGNLPDKDAFSILQELQSSAGTREIRLMWLMPEESDAEALRGWHTGMDGIVNPGTCGEEIACLVRLLFDGPDSQKNA